MQDYIVRMDWSVSGEGLWMCGFSCLCYLAVERNEAGKVGMGVVSGCGQCLGKGQIVLQIGCPIAKIQIAADLHQHCSNTVDF